MTKRVQWGAGLLNDRFHIDNYMHQNKQIGLEIIIDYPLFVTLITVKILKLNLNSLVEKNIFMQAFFYIRELYSQMFMFTAVFYILPELAEKMFNSLYYKYYYKKFDSNMNIVPYFKLKNFRTMSFHLRLSGSALARIWFYIHCRKLWMLRLSICLYYVRLFLEEQVWVTGDRSQKQPGMDSGQHSTGYCMRVYEKGA